MNLLADILADGEFSRLLQAILVIIIMVVIGGAQVLQKLAKDKKQREQQDRDGALTRPKPLGRADEVDRQQLDLRQPTAMGSRPAELPAYGLPAQQGEQTLPRRRGVRRDLRQPRVAAAMPIIVTEPQDEEVEQVVEEELRRQQQRLAREEAERRRRMAEPKPQVARRPSVLSVQPKVKPTMAATAAGEVERRVAVDLTDADVARRAIIYHEIFSGPKALRTETEIWDM